MVDESLAKAVRFQLKHGDPISPSGMLRALAYLHKGPTNFAPVLARWIVDRYAPLNGTVLDPCAGFGGRLLGTLASSHNLKYIGFDIEPKTTAGNQQLADMLGMSVRVVVKACDAIVEDWPEADLVLTGPPYFDQENYGEKSSAVLAQFDTVEAWLQGFLGPLIDKAMKAAPIAVINIGSINRAGKRIELAAMASVLVAERGYELAESLVWRLPFFGKTSSLRDERLLVIRRMLPDVSDQAADNNLVKLARQRISDSAGYSSLINEPKDPDLLSGDIFVHCSYCELVHVVRRVSYDKNIKRNGRYICERYGGHLAGKKPKLSLRKENPYAAVGNKECSICQRILAVDLFDVRRKSFDGLNAACKVCISAKNKAKYLAKTSLKPLTSLQIARRK